MAAVVRTPNRTLMALRERAGLSQEELARGLGGSVGKRNIGRWERGEVTWPARAHQRALAEFFDVALEDLGFRRPHRSSGSGSDPSADAGDEYAVRTRGEQERWRAVREYLGRHRRDLAVAVEQLYPDLRVEGLHDVGVISPPGWIPAEPIPLDDLELSLDSRLLAPAVTGAEEESATVRPHNDANRRYRRYHDAIRELAAPTLFENRLCFRVCDIDLPHLQLNFGQMGFFDAIDVNEALAHETALHRDTLDWGQLPLRTLVGDPGDLDRRALMGAIGTLTIRASASPSMVLHRRDGGRVAGGGGMTHLLPAGIFQPSSYLPAAVENDFSIWRTIQREFAEELLGFDEYDGTGAPIDYERTEPFVAMDTARADGALRVYFLGATLDALTLAGDLLTVAVIDADTYDALFGDSVQANDEGRLLGASVPFDDATITQLRNSGLLSPGASAAIHLAWQHRDLLLPPITAQPAHFALRVAIAVAVSGDKVLLTHRRDTGQWQFPAGMIKPGADSATVAARETFAETGVRVETRRYLGERLHPDTGVLCDYWIADHISGNPSNLDPAENTAAVWCLIADLPSHIPRNKMYPPVYDALEALRAGDE